MLTFGDPDLNGEHDLFLSPRILGFGELVVETLEKWCAHGFFGGVLSFRLGRPLTGLMFEVFEVFEVFSL